MLPGIVIDFIPIQLANADVSFNINGIFYTRQTNESGYANLNLRLQPGEYIVTADYKGLKYSNIVNILHFCNILPIFVCLMK